MVAGLSREPHLFAAYACSGITPTQAAKDERECMAALPCLLVTRRRHPALNPALLWKIYVGFWLYDTGCFPVRISATLSGDPKSKREATIPFSCGDWSRRGRSCGGPDWVTGYLHDDTR